MLQKLLSRWVKNKEATTAIEFSLLAIPYIFLTVGIIELAITYATASLLEGAVADAARMVRTGQLQQSGAADPEAVFRTALCDYAQVLINCDDVVIESMTLNSYYDYASAGPIYDEDGNMISSGFNAGGVNDRVLIRAAYRYTMMTPFIGPLLAGPDNTMLFMSTIVLQTEPYQFLGGAS